MARPVRGYTVMEHMGDLRLSLRAPTLGALFEVAGEALFDNLADGEVNLAPVACVRLAAADGEALLVDWLNELVYLHSVGGWLLRRFRVTMDGPTVLKAEVEGERFDTTRHQVRLEVKAATFHRLSLHFEGGEWRAEVILDL